MALTDTLLERSRELASIDSLLECAGAGRGGVVVFEGGPGMGKTSLLAAARERAAVAGLTALTGRGIEMEDDFAFGVLRQLLVPALRGRGELSWAAAPAAPALGLAAVSGEVPERADVAHAVYWLVSELADERPLLLLVDDLHWVDAASRRVLVHLAHRLEELPVAMLLATRPDETAALDVDALLREPHVTEMRPRGLSPAAVSLLIERVMERGGPSERFLDACLGVIGGVPFLVIEVLRELAAEGLAPDGTAVAALRDLAPRTVQRNVLVRLARLGGPARELACTVSLFPGGARFADAAAVTGLDDRTMTEAAEALQAAEVLRAERPLDFLHPVMRAAVYADLSPERRSEGHLRAARVLAERGDDPEAIAAHLLQGDDAGEPWAAEVLEQAGRRARDAGAPEAAVAYFARALAGTRGPARASVQADLGRARLAAGDGGGLEDLEDAHRDAPDAETRAAIAHDLAAALMYERQRPADAAALLWEAAGEFPERHPERLRALAHLGLYCDRWPETALYTQRVLDAIPSDLAGDTAAERALLLFLADRAIIDSTHDRLRTLVERAVASPAYVEEEPPGSVTVDFGFYLLRVMGEHGRSEDLARRIWERDRRAGLTSHATRVLAYRARNLLRLARVEEAEGLAAEAAAALPYVGDGTKVVVAGLSASVLVARGRLEEAAAMLAEAPDPRPDALDSGYTLEARADLAVARGDLDAALAHYRTLMRLWEALGTQNIALLEFPPEIPMVLAAAGRRDEARELVARQLEQVQAWGAPQPLGWVLHAQGVVEGGASGARLIRQAIEHLQGADAAYARLRALADLGAVLRRDGRRAEAREPLRAALDGARRAGALLLAAQVDDELEATGARKRARELSGVASLTPSEQRICRLAAEGASNKEIAQRLFLTVKTVEMHLRNAYRKLDIASRRELSGALEVGVPG